MSNLHGEWNREGNSFKLESLMEGQSVGVERWRERLLLANALVNIRNRDTASVSSH